MWYDTFNDVFWIAISSALFAFLGLTIKSILSSKCDQTNLCWGMIQIHRRVELENITEGNTNATIPIREGNSTV